MNTTGYEITQLLYEIVDRLARIEQHLGIKDTKQESEGEVVFEQLSVVESKAETVVKFPTPE